LRSSVLIARSVLAEPIATMVASGLLTIGVLLMALVCNMTQE